MVWIVSEWFGLVQNGLDWLRIVQIGSEWFGLVQNGLDWLRMVWMVSK